MEVRALQHSENDQLATTIRDKATDVRLALLLEVRTASS